MFRLESNPGDGAVLPIFGFNYLTTVQYSKYLQISQIVYPF